MEVSLAAQLADLQSAHDRAQKAFEGAHEEYADEDSTDTANWLIEVVFLKLLVLAEHWALPGLRLQIAADMERARTGAGGFSFGEFREGDFYSQWLLRIRQYMRALETLAGPPASQLVNKPLEDILRSCVYPITDPTLFAAPPSREDDVHRRIEGILKCVFPDLQHKPALAKPIKNFIPDTGLPSTKTLIEYKFISSEAESKIVADQVLADTRGYHSPEYDNYVYVIYETIRVKRESEWRALLSSCGVPPNTSIIVLSGIPPREKPAAKGSGSDAEV
jgi:hypothetical protein